MRSLVALCLLLAAPALAQAPQKVRFNSKLVRSDGTPETGTLAIRFAIFSQATGGTELWSETQPAVAVTQGLMETTLGELTAFPNALFDGTERFLEVAISGVALTPRMRLVSVPYAISAGTASSVNGGTVNASSISVGGNAVIDSSGNLVGNATYQGANGVSVTGRTIGLVPGCQAGETLKWSGAPTNAWQCAAGALAASDGGVVAYTADPDGGLQFTDSNFTQFSLLRSCTANQLLKWSGSAWVCADDSTGTSYNIASGQGLALSGAQSNLFGLQNCTTGQILKSGGGNWACQADSDTQYTATVNRGLLLTGTGFGLDACAAGMVMKSQGGGNWACAADNSAAYDVVVNGGLQRTGNNFGIGTGGVTNAMLANSSVTVSAGTGLSGGGAVSLGGATTLSLSTPVSAANGGTGLTAGPTAAGQFLRSSAAGAWSVATLSASDVPSLSSTYVDLTSSQTIGGVKTFSSTISGSISGNAGTVTNGVVTTGSYADPAWITLLAGSKITGNIGGNAAGITGNLGGDVTGPQSSTTVARIRGTSVSASVPAANQLLAYNSGTFQWTPTALTATAGGGVSVSGLSVGLTTCAANQVLRHNGTNWVCSSPIAACTWAVDSSTANNQAREANCPASTYVVSGGCVGDGVATLLHSYAQPEPSNGSAVTAATSWLCSFSVASTNHKAMALCCP